MHALHVQVQVDAAVGLQGAVGVDAGDDVVVAGRRRVQVHLLAQRFDQQHAHGQDVFPPGEASFTGSGHGLRPHAEDDLLTGPGCEGVFVSVGQAEAGGALVEVDAVVFHDACALEEIHRRRADEPRHETVGRAVVYFQRRADLLHEAVFHHDDAVAECHGLFLVVGDVEGGRLELPVQALEFGPHLNAELGVEVAERLVEQEGGGLPDDGPPDGHPLPLPAGKGLGLALQQVLDVQNARGLTHARVDLGFREPPQLQRERHVLVHGHVRVQGVVLEDHGDVAILGGHVVDDAVADANGPLGDLLQPGDHPQRRALAAPAGADQHGKLGVGDVQVHRVHGGHVAGKDLRDVLKNDLCHGLPRPRKLPVKVASL